MTAEVVILNKSAVAMAADSKGTLTIGKVTKTHDTLNKLFTLSKYHPVGVMIYGNVEYSGALPWETIIKLYRDKLKEIAFPRLGNYASDFLYSLPRDHEIPSDIQSLNAFLLANDFLNRLLREARGYQESAMRSGVNISEIEALEESLRDWMEKIENSRLLWNFRSISSDELLNQYSNEIDTAIENVFDGFHLNELKESIKTAVSDCFRREIFSDDFATGIVFAGFGDSQIFPSYKSYMIDGIISNRIRVAPYRIGHITKYRSAIVTPYAQKDMVVRFMEGVDPDYNSYIQESIRSFANSIIGTMIDTYGKGTKKFKEEAKVELNDLVSGKLSEMFLEARNYRKEFFIDPITSMVQMLTKSDMAHLAESLVNLTSLKRRMSLDEESVGGPIDVAVISKGDGFIWIKRKHYFDSSLNGSFALNYFKNHLDAKGETGHDRHAKK